MKGLLHRLREHGLDGIDADSGERLQAHQRILARKPLLREVFHEFHQTLNRLDERYLFGNGPRIELGAGVAPIRDSFPDVLATDVVPGTHLDRVLDAEQLDLPTGSVRVLFGQNCFHHFARPERFFEEALRVLSPGGGIILLEPYYGKLARILYPRLFASEGYDLRFPSWDTPNSGPMNGANQALAYIVFVRDRETFRQKFPELEIVHEEPCTNELKYLLSGGLNFRQLIPNAMIPVARLIQSALLPFRSLVALHHLIVLRKSPR